MKKILSLFIMCFLVLGGIFAEEQSEVQPEENDEFEYVYKTNQGGDSFIRMSLGMDIPIKPKMPQMKIGGSGTLGFYKFITGWFAVGGDFSFAYSETLGSNVYYFVPLMARTIFQFTVDNFEFPLFIGIGGSFQNYVDRMYFGLTINPEIGCFYRFRPDWSVGIIGGAYILPQWFDNEEYNYTGVIATVSISARYHF